MSYPYQEATAGQSGGYPDVTQSAKDAGAAQRLTDTLSKLLKVEGGLAHVLDGVVGPRPAQVQASTQGAPTPVPSLTLLISRLDEAVNRCMNAVDQIGRSL